MLSPLCPHQKVVHPDKISNKETTELNMSGDKMDQKDIFCPQTEEYALISEISLKLSYFRL